MDPQRQQLLFDLILELDSKAFADRNFETAYHLLMAALHVGGDPQLGDADLDRLERLAGEHAAAVEAARPPHPLSRARAHQRGHQSLFESLLRHLDSVRARRKSERGQRHAAAARAH